MTTLLLAFTILVQQPRDSLTIQECYRAAELNYPLRNQLELQDEIARLTTQNLKAGSLPSLTLGGHAIYYSDVATISGPAAPTVSHDQYKASLLVEQAIYDGGLKSGQRAITELQSDIEKQKVRIDLNKLREQINASFVGALLYGGQIETLQSVARDLESRLARVDALIDNGASLRSNGDALRVEILRNQQTIDEAEANRETMRAVLGLLIGRELSPDEVLSVPQPDVDSVDPDAHLQPEYEAFDLSRKLLDSQAALLSKKQNPLLGAFVEMAYGRPPGLNLFEDSLTPFYSFGLRMQWKPWDWRITDREKDVIEVRRRVVDSQEETLTTNLSLALERERRRIDLLEEQLKQDEEIIALQTQIKVEAGSRLEQGVLTASEYVTEVTAETRALFTKSLHRLQLIQAKLSYLTTLGEQP